MSIIYFAIGDFLVSQVFPSAGMIGFCSLMVIPYNEEFVGVNVAGNKNVPARPLL